MNGQNSPSVAMSAGADRQQTEIEVLRERLSCIVDAAQNTTHRLENITCRLTGPQQLDPPSLTGGLGDEVDTPTGFMADLGVQMLRIEETQSIARNWLEQLERML